MQEMDIIMSRAVVLVDGKYCNIRESVGLTYEYDFCIIDSLSDLNLIGLRYGNDDVHLTLFLYDLNTSVKVD